VTVKIGSTVKMAFVDQNRDDLANDKTVWEDVSGGLDILNVGKFQMASRAYCGRFNFNGGDQQKRVGTLSGGERGRLHLAKTLIAGGNVLMLDEPSNDLDVETLRALEDALLEFAGTMLVISHDRWFLDRIATHILACEGDSQWTFFDGNYQEYEADKKKRLGEEGRAHAHGVGAPGGKHADLGRGFKLRAQRPQVGALTQRHLLGLRQLAGVGQQLGVVRGAHVDKARVAAGSPTSGERCGALMWSVISIRLPGGMWARRLPAALVCSSSLTPQAFQAAQRTGHAGAVAVS
jgi:energy-coupling factor transporter ATP-binding protein EcfA2